MKQTLCIYRIAIATPLRRVFEYLPVMGADQPAPGVRIRVPFGKREMIGILLEIRNKAEIALDRLKPALEILDKEPLFNKNLFELCQWASNYYHHAAGEVFLSALPTLLRKGRKTLIKKKVRFIPADRQTLPLALNSDQQQAVTRVINDLDQFKVFLLDGVTGSGKTEVYLQIIASVVQRGQQALVLVPEIALTPQTLARFRERFNIPIAVWHSALTEKERLQAWIEAREGTAQIIIGTRSTLFTPMAKPGVIIIDEEHDLSFKQQEGFRYSARDLAIIRARLEKIPIVLGSATPSLETLHNVWMNKYQHLRLPERAGNALHPQFQILDMRNQPLTSGLSQPLIALIKQHIAQNNQVLLFLNRRGYAPVLLCHSCGWIAKCQRCDANMTIHHGPSRLYCHHCSATRNVDQNCPQCAKTGLFPIGLGTEKIELALRELFPECGIARIDRDATRRKGSLETILNDIHDGRKNILIGTQMIAKGHHFPNVTLVAVIDTDAGLFSADFRSPERLGQLLLQVAGRAGRADKLGTVVIQTHHPDHPLLNTLIKEGYTAFIKKIAADRQAAVLPPFAYLAMLRAESVTKIMAMDFLQQVAAKAHQFNNSAVTILGPIPAPMEKRAGRYRSQLLLVSKQRQHLQTFLVTLLESIDTIKVSRKVRWALDVDPLEMF